MTKITAQDTYVFFRDRLFTAFLLYFNVLISTTSFPFVFMGRAPVANILKSESINDTSAPVVASFSARGPNSVAADILKV